MTLNKQPVESLAADLLERQCRDGYDLAADARAGVRILDAKKVQVYRARHQSIEAALAELTE
jgi:hypothetical protein